MKGFNCACTIAVLGVTAVPAAAQSHGNFQQGRPTEVRIQAGLVIPLSGGGSGAERALRFEAWSDHRAYQQVPQPSLRSDFDQPQVQPIRIGVNFSGQPRLMVNGREALGKTDRKNISGLGIAGIAVGVVVVAVAVFAIEYKTSGLGD